MDTFIGAVLGFAFGYYLGTKGGVTTSHELRQAIDTITSSDEVKALRASAPDLIGAVLKQGITMLGKQVVGLSK